MKRIILIVLLMSCVSGGNGENVPSGTRNVVFTPRIPKNLIEAAEYGDMEKIKEYLQKNPESLNKHEYGYTALHHAALSGENEVVIYLIEQGALTQIKDEKGNVYTEEVLEYSDSLNPKALEKILEKTTKEKVDKYLFGEMLVNIMVKEHKEEERIEILQLLNDWSQGTELSLNTPGMNEKTMLISAVIYKRYKSLEFLLNILTINVNAQGKGKNTALHMAVLGSNEKAVKLLLTRNDLDLDLKNKQNKTVLDLAKGEIKDMLEEYKKNN